MAPAEPGQTRLAGQSPSSVDAIKRPRSSRGTRRRDGGSGRRHQAVQAGRAAAGLTVTHGPETLASACVYHPASYISMMSLVVVLVHIP